MQTISVFVYVWLHPPSPRKSTLAGTNALVPPLTSPSLAATAPSLPSVAHKSTASQLCALSPRAGTLPQVNSDSLRPVEPMRSDPENRLRTSLCFEKPVSIDLAFRAFLRWHTLWYFSNISARGAVHFATSTANVA